MSQKQAEHFLFLSTITHFMATVIRHLHRGEPRRNRTVDIPTSAAAEMLAVNTPAEVVL